VQILRIAMVARNSMASQGPRSQVRAHCPEMDQPCYFVLYIPWNRTSPAITLHHLHSSLFYDNCLGQRIA
jgi:hypothetical protein